MLCAEMYASASLTLGSKMCLLASGAIIRAADSSVTVPLITISSGARASTLVNSWKMAG